MIVQKKTGKMVKAYCLGQDSDAEQQMLRDGKMKKYADGTYELFSQEAVNQSGQTAHAGDFFKVDSKGFPYPNSRKFFLENHTPLPQPNSYIQNPLPLKAWDISLPQCEEIRWLLHNHRLTLNPLDNKKYFNAFLWGAPLSTPKDSIIIFHQVICDASGNILDIDFAFIEKSEFLKTYDVISQT